MNGSRADVLLERMRADRESDWWERLLHRIAMATTALTPRELDVLRCASVGMSEAESGVLLGIVAGTVDRHRESARVRLGAKNTTHAVALALRQGLIT